VSRELSYAEAIREALRQEMQADERVVLLGEDVGVYGGAFGVTDQLLQEFGPERVRDTPISEAAMTGCAIGAALTGLRPVLEIQFMDFVTLCMEQLVLQAAKIRYMFGGKAQVPLVVRTMIGAGFRAAGQHSGCHYSVFTHMPGMKTVVASTPYDAKGLLISAIRDPDPVIFFEHKLLYDTTGEVPEEDYAIPLGVADVKRQGKNVTIVTIGRMVHFALEAAEKLAQDGIDAEVIDLRTLSPLDDKAVLDSVKKTHRLVVVDEDNPRCSMATDIVALVSERAFDYLDSSPRMVTAPHTPVPFSPPLEDYYVPSVDKIVSTVKSVAA